MTLPAFDSWAVRGLLGRTYKVGPYCSNPLCTKLAEHAHHIVRRSQIQGDYYWVEIDGEIVIGNVTGLCPRCHDEITGVVGGHRAAIRWHIDPLDGTTGFWWCRIVTNPSGEVTYFPVDLLSPQPPTPDALAASPAAEESDVKESDRCPTCGHLTRSRPAAAAPAAGRKRKTWMIKVPDDEQEHGADVLDVLLDDLAPLFGYEPTASARYYVVAAALAYAQQDRKRFIESLRGVGA